MTIYEKMKKAINYWNMQPDNIYDSYYLYYRPVSISTGKDSDIKVINSNSVACKDKPDNYILLHSERIKRNFSIDQNIRYFMQFTGGLPIISIEELIDMEFDYYITYGKG